MIQTSAYICPWSHRHPNESLPTLQAGSSKYFESLTALYIGGIVDNEQVGDCDSSSPSKKFSLLDTHLFLETINTHIRRSQHRLTNSRTRGIFGRYFITLSTGHVFPGNSRLRWYVPCAIAALPLSGHMVLMDLSRLSLRTGIVTYIAPKTKAL